MGFPWFDKRRGAIMGFATVTTLMAIFITTYGCFSLANDPDVVRFTFWVRANAYNTTAFVDDEQGFPRHHRSAPTQLYVRRPQPIS